MDLNKDILVSVLFPVHKENPFLQAALTSILEQTFTNFELLFLDNSKKGIPTSAWNLDPRIKYVKLPSTHGLSESLNSGIHISVGKYLARMDFDDYSLPTRFSEQLAYLELHDDVSILGTGIRIMGEKLDIRAKVGDELLRPDRPDQIVAYLKYKNPVFHPTVMMRSSSIRQFNLYYDKKYDGAEDFELWMRASHVVKIANLTSILLRYRLHGDQYSRIGSSNTNFLAAKIRLRHCMWILMNVREDRLSAVKAILRTAPKLPILFFRKLIRSRYRKFN